jgi:hypothetical protein
VGQVWRFLVNAELTTIAYSFIPCPVPPCALADFPMHWVGHIDFACAPSGNPLTDPRIWSVDLSLHHLPGIISHNPSTLPPRGLPAGQDHLYDSYHVVSPASFVWFPVAQPPFAGTAAPASGCTGAQPGLPSPSAQGFRTELTAGACNLRGAPLNVNSSGVICDSIQICSSPQGWWDIQFGPFGTSGTPSNAALNSRPCGST